MPGQEGEVAALVGLRRKAGAAQRAHLARPTFYQRLRQIERILGVDLDSAESRTSLHVALLAQPAATDQQPS